MERVESSKVMTTPQLENVPDLLHHIQTFLPVKDAARTSVLSKSWLHAWSTIPTLRFRQSLMCVSKDEQENHLNLMDRNLLRYVRDNISIESLDVLIDNRIQESASLTEKWIKHVASKRYLKELYVTLSTFPLLEENSLPGELTLPGEIFSGNNLDTIRVKYSGWPMNTYVWLSGDPVINCASLRVLELENVSISDEVIHNLLSASKVLEKISLCTLYGDKTIKVKNLRCLRDLKFISVGQTNVLEIDNVPSLRVFHYSGENWPKSLNTDSLGGLTHLSLGDIIVDDSLLNMIQSKFPCLESLSIQMRRSRLERLNIKCASLKRLTLILANKEIHVKVSAPKLLSFSYHGMKMPSLSFSTISPREIKLILMLWDFDNSFFIKMRETFNLSSNPFDIQIIIGLTLPYIVNIDIDDLRRRVPFPAMNVQQLSFRGAPDQRWWQQMHIVDAFNVICHPSCVSYFEQRWSKTTSTSEF